MAAEIITMGQDEHVIPSELPVLPVRGMVLFPEMAMPVLVGKDSSKKLVDEALVGDKLVIISSVKDQNVEDPGPEDIYAIGTVAQIVKKITLPNDAYQVIIRGMRKARISEYSQTEPYLRARIMALEENLEVDKETEAMILNIRKLFQKVIELSSLPPELAVVVMNVDEPTNLAALVASNLDVSAEQKQELLETTDLKELLEKIAVFLNQQVEKLELSADIQKKIQDGMNKNQREFLLREQLKAIQKELGEGDERTVEISELKKRIEEAGLPAEAREVAEKELDRLSKMSPAAAEYTVSRTYLDWILDLPWSVSTEDKPDLERAEQILN
jgi:ATP-dependent Lon protease